MRVVLTGANGFIGSAISTAILAEGHVLVAAIRNPVKFTRRFPNAVAIELDLNKSLDSLKWQSDLQSADVLINCAGILQTDHVNSAGRVHTEGPRELFQAAVAAGVSKIIQISAVSADAATEYAKSKRSADDFLKQQDCRWTILRPSLVYGETAFGGTSMLRALAAFPYCIPLMGTGQQKITPIHVDDFAKSVVHCLSLEVCDHKIITPCGPETITIASFTAKYRGWLGLPAAPVFSVPPSLVALAARIGDTFGTGPLKTTSVLQLEHGNAADPEKFSREIGFKPRLLDKALIAKPSDARDLWHARLYLLKPVIRSCLIMIWLASGILGLTASTDQIIQALPIAGFSPSASTILARMASVIDLLLALALLYNIKPRLTGWGQLALVTSYTVAITLFAPWHWADLFGGILKNLAVLPLIVVNMVLAEER